MPIAGSMSRSSGGGRTRLTGVFCVAFVVVTLLWLTPVFGALPHAALAAIIIMSVSDFIDFTPIYRYWTFYRHDSITHVVALLGVLVFGVERGLLIGMLVAVALFVRRSSRPHIAIVGRIGDSAHFRSQRRYDVVTHPHVTAVRIDENLYFANANLVEERLLRLVSRNPNIRHLLLVCSAINFIDTSGLEMLERLDRELMRRDVQLHLSEVKGPVMDQLNAADFPTRTVRAHLLHDRRGDARAEPNRTDPRLCRPDALCLSTGVRTGAREREGPRCIQDTGRRSRPKNPL